MNHPSIKVLLFSSLRERVGQHAIILPLVGPVMAASDVMDLLCSEYPSISPYREYIRLAVNDRYVDLSYGVKPGDELALITPVSGG